MPVRRTRGAACGSSTRDWYPERKEADHSTLFRHAPFQDPAGEVLSQLDFEPKGGGLDRPEAHLVKRVLRRAVFAHALDRLPLPGRVAVEQFPGRRDAATAASRFVVEP